MSKKKTFESFIKEYLHFKSLSSHKFTKWMKTYAKDASLIYEHRKAGEKYEFYLKPKNLGKEASDA